MAKMHKLEGKIELNCSAEKIFEIKKCDVAEICSHKVPAIHGHHGDWHSVGSTRTWDFIIGEKTLHIVDRIEEVDEKNMTITRSVIDGDLMTHYKTLTTRFQTISKENGKSCIVKCSMEYEKINEDAPEPQELLSFGLGVLKELAHHISSAN
ncbi:hypothetical protein RND81_02G225100 [Saponaria officinalis]|uniref:Bet v I/Major latex protein domain-containing protein n=1 Tax=Saponaria officinalis TaxID=3572 RepID=A0AAW1MPI5_SAPOF